MIGSLNWGMGNSRNKVHACQVWKRSARGYLAARPMLPSWQLADLPRFSGQQSKTKTNKH